MKMSKYEVVLSYLTILKFVLRLFSNELSILVKILRSVNLRKSQIKIVFMLETKHFSVKSVKRVAGSR